jgi:Putative Actinobacterial Holin-X, holin superfamily III
MNSKVENIRPKTEIITFTGLLGQLANNLAALIHDEIELITQGVREEVGVLRRGVLIVAIGAVISFAGFLSLCAALIIGLTYYMSPVSAALVTGAALALIGVVFAYIGYKQLQKSILSNKEENTDIKKEDKG